jgi:hypothetical protein
MQPPEVRGKLVLYCFRGGGTAWVEPRAQSCPKADEWCGRSATSRRNRIAKACRDWISAEDVAVAEQKVGEDRSSQQRWGGRGATARRNRIAKACRVWISAEYVAVAERGWCAVKANKGGENSACAACAADSSLRGKPEDATAGERASKKEHPTVKW